jgi:hypothetical protein
LQIKKRAAFGPSVFSRRDFVFVENFSGMAYNFLTLKAFKGGTENGGHPKDAPKSP